MMKNLRKNGLVSLIIVLAILALLSGTVNAAGVVLINSATTENQAVENDVTNEVENNVSTNILGITNNVQKVNNINDATKDIPQTGENDVYMITAIGIAAIVIGGIAFAKSKKYDIQ